MFVACLLALAVPKAMPEKWVYLATNLLVEANVDNNITLLKRAKSAGYTGFVVADSKFTRWNQLPQRYKDNAKRFRETARSLGLQFVACVAPVGYSNDLLAGDPNLAEGLPVKGAEFQVDGNNDLVPVDDSAGFVNGGFESNDNGKPTGWSWIDAPGVSTFIDSSVKVSGSSSLRMSDPIKGAPDSGNCRASQLLKVKPFHYYHVSFQVKTEDLDNPNSVEVKAIGKSGQSLSFRSLPIKRTMDWTPLDVTFNTLDNSEVNFYVGIWGGKSGTLWWDDVKIEQGGFVNLVRRPGAPFKVTSLDGKTVYREGIDLQPVSDPKMGNAQWPGDYDTWHTPPAVKIVPGHGLKAGDRVVADYYHTALIYDGQAMVCMAEPKTDQLLLDVVKQVHTFLHPDGYMLSHDEIRMTGWDESCERSGKNPAQLLADNVRKCTNMVKNEDPGKRIFAWSDMFDPNHNAAKDGFYYLLKGKGPWSGSWLGLAQDVTVFNWNSDPSKRVASLQFFANRGHRQILAGYYDGPTNAIKGWIKDSAGIKGVDGVMYTTWVGDYSKLEDFAAATK